MNLSADQQRALDSISHWLKNKSAPSYTLHGLAGCGKTTLARYIAELQNGQTIFAAFTGKAADVLSRKGCPATTIHSLIYLPANERNAEAESLQTKLAAGGLSAVEERRVHNRLIELNSPSWVLRENSPLRSAKLLILDECSLIDERMARDILSFNVPTLVLGDPGQLPPIEGKIYFDKPDFELTEIHRQALESPVLRLALKARNGEMLPYGPNGTSKVISMRAVDRDSALGVDQIITGSNKARLMLNVENRKLRGFEGVYPQAGERVICLRNNPREGLLNGQAFTTTNDTDEPDGPIVKMHLDNQSSPRVHKLCFTRPLSIKSMDYRRRAAANEFDYSYAITAHKAQGSQWDSVMVYADQFRWDRELFKKWLYCAVTRACDRVIVAI